MEPGSQVSEPPEQTSHALANLIGTVIALLTLAVPIAAIAHFSPASESLPMPTQFLPSSQD